MGVRRGTAFAKEGLNRSTVQCSTSPHSWLLPRKREHHNVSAPPLFNKICFVSTNVIPLGIIFLLVTCTTHINSTFSSTPHPHGSAPNQGAGGATLKYPVCMFLFGFPSSRPTQITKLGGGFTDALLRGSFFTPKRRRNILASSPSGTNTIFFFKVIDSGVCPAGKGMCW